MAGQQSSAASDLSVKWTEEDRAARGDAPPPAPADYGEPVVDTTKYGNAEGSAARVGDRL